MDCINTVVKPIQENDTRAKYLGIWERIFTNEETIKEYDNILRYENQNIEVIEVMKFTTYTMKLVGNVINLSLQSFSKGTYKLLNKYLKFVPTQTKYNEKHLSQDIDNFYKRIKLSPNFRQNDANKKQAEEDIFKPPSNKNWQPKNTYYTIQTFINLTFKKSTLKKQNTII